VPARLRGEHYTYRLPDQQVTIDDPAIVSYYSAVHYPMQPTESRFSRAIVLEYFGSRFSDAD
jgi:hypothetical protein